MAYIAAPQVLESNTILLDGADASTPKYYRLRGPVQVVQATQFPGKITIGDFGKNENPIISTVSWSDLRGGMGLYRMKDESQIDRFWTSQNIDTLHANAITLGALVTSISAGVDFFVTAINVLSDLLTVAFSNRIYTHDGTSWSALVDTLPNAPRDSILFNARIFYAEEGSGYSYQAAGGAVATDVALPLFLAFAVWDNKLYGLDTAGVLYSSTTGNAASWTTLAGLDLTGTNVVNYDRLFLRVYDDANGEPTIWAITPTGPFLYDATNDKWFRSRFQAPRYQQGEPYPFFGSTYRESLFLQTAERKIFKLTMGSGTLLVEDVTLGAPDGVPSEYTSAVRGSESNNDFLFALAGYSYANAIRQPIGLFVYNGRGWHNIFRHSLYTTTTTTDTGLIKATTVRSGTAIRNRLYFHVTDDTSGNTLRWLNLYDLPENPLTSTTRTYAASGQLELPFFDGGYEAQQKTAIQVRIKVTGATANETVQVAYRIDGSTGSYTNLGSAITATTEQTLKFGTNNVGLGFKSIQLKLTLARGSTTTLAPKIEYIALDFMRLPDVLKGFSLTIDCTNDAPDGRSPRTQIDDLWTTIALNTLCTFAYRDDAGNTQSYLVKAMRPQGTEETGEDYRGQYQIYLASFGSN
jgi:hypothetical protein